MSRLAARDLWVAPPGAPDPVVRGVSMAVERGEWVALTGPNGGGKTTLLLALAGLWPAARGTVELDGHPFGPHADPTLRARVASLLQDPSSQLLQPTLREELEFTARNLGMADEDIESQARRWVEAFDLAVDLDRDPSQLSAGRQQLALIAAALVSRPAVLCADEPTAHLDPRARSRVGEIIAREVEQGLAVVWVTQDAGEMSRAHRCIEIGARSPAMRIPARRVSGPEGPAVLSLAVSAWYGLPGPRVAVARPLEIPVADRFLTVLTGPNGVGKSVLLAAAAGLGRVGQVRPRWHRIAEPPPVVALQFPELQVFEEKVADEVAYAAVSRGVPRRQAIAAAAQCFEALGLEPGPFLERRTWDLAGGERRLVEVVAALIAPASLVVLDEPTAGLDAERREALGHLLVARCDQGPILAASQDRLWVEELGGRVVELEAIGTIEAASVYAKSN